ncbi:uncharacterized protein LOC119606989 [Lucilia sericata]|uniref:uncharacterized protein LOC119606989 n=1 Tax=Lucilia sericata TaxID=13632 RepID=UPI0018A87AB2|nr:uncharacterized protein LOC119606989 [Lucilia sericata]
MYKIITVLFLIVLAVVANGEETQNLDLYNYVINYNTSVRTDEYINMNRQQYAKNVQDYDKQIEVFKQSYAASLDTINIRQDMLIDTLVQTEQKLNPLEILSNLSQKCVSKYRSSIPTVAATKTKLNNCVTTANQQLNSMLSSPLSTRNSLENYYKNNFERDIASCQKTYNALPLNYTMCITDVVNAANSYTINNQKNFATQMNVAECSAKANINKALDCSYIVEKQTISSIAEAETLIQKCLAGQDECKQCNLYSCSEVHNMKRYEISYTSKTMENPFYGRNDIKNCLMLQIY